MPVAEGSQRFLLDHPLHNFLGLLAFVAWSWARLGAGFGARIARGRAFGAWSFACRALRGVAALRAFLDEYILGLSQVLFQRFPHKSLGLDLGMNHSYFIIKTGFHLF